MQITIRPLDIVSRGVAVFVIGVPIAWLVILLGAWELEDVRKMNHQQLIEYVTTGHDLSFAAQYALILLFSFVYVGLCEGLALLLRLIVRAVQPAGSERNARAGMFVDVRDPDGCHREC
jgi:hypothetical protein